MAEKLPTQAPPSAAGEVNALAGAGPASAQALGSATYEIIRQRLGKETAVFRERVARLNARRQEVFGSIEFKLLQAFRIVTAHNCIPQDMIQLGEGRFLFGFNVQFGLKKEIELADVFAVYAHDEPTGTFKESELQVLGDSTFITDFKRLYNVYEKASFQKFSLIEGTLFMVFSIGDARTDIAVFKWAFNDGNLHYVDSRAESEFRTVGFPSPFEFRWRTPDRESFRYGDHPHVSIEDRVFVECVGGDLTIKVEDNTATGEGIYSEPVEDQHQKVDDAEISYAAVDHLVLLRIRPYKESQPRCFIFNEKTQQAVRVDSLAYSCVLLPEAHGLIFPDGYYLATGELKLFDTRERDLVIEKVIHSPNGEDSLFVFYNRQTGLYVLLPYRLTSQKVEERIACHGFTLFPNGHLISFRAEHEPQKHHLLQLRQTPFHEAGREPEGKRDTFLYQVGNKDVVRCLAECNEVLTLAGQESPYAQLYSDLVKRCGSILDAYPWLASDDGFQVNLSLGQLRDIADKAVDEFDKVRALQREAAHQLSDVRTRTNDRLQAIRRASFKSLNDYVSNLAALRHLRGELITLKDAPYLDVSQVEVIERQVAGQADELSRACVTFLLKPEALEPHRQRAAEQLAAVAQIGKAAKARQLEKAVSVVAGELEMLIEIVNNLRIEDATETTRIIDGITAVYATLNQVRAALKKRLQELATAEAAEQFSAQLKLLSQAAASYLDLCDTPAKCDEYLNRISVQLEELEGAFAEFEDYTVQLAERRAALYEAFEQRKLALVEQRSRKANALMTAAERILKVIQNRLAGCKTIEEINTYMAADLMISKVRETVNQLLQLEDSVRADDLEGRLKSAQQDAIRQLKDRQELFVGNEPVIRLGKHRFNVNTQPLDLTIINREGVQNFHLTSTKYFEPIAEEAFLATSSVWGQEVVSENEQVYRGEYLAYQLLRSLLETPSHASPEGNGSGTPKAAGPGLMEVLQMSEPERLSLIHGFISARYNEGYTKGVHDLDAAQIFDALASIHAGLRLGRYSPSARACAMVYWQAFCPADTRALWSAKLAAFAERNRLFPGDPVQQNYIAALRGLISAWLAESRLYPSGLDSEAGEYLFYELAGGGDAFVVTREAERLSSLFNQYLVQKGTDRVIHERREALVRHPASELELVRDWVRGFLLARPGEARFLEEVAAVLFCTRSDTPLKLVKIEAESSRTLDGMRGSHPVIQGAKYHFDYLAFQRKLRQFTEEVVPRFEQYQRLKQSLLENERACLRLSEFAPRVLTSFVRNQLIDEVYLPLIGDNLAKQIGAAGNQKRTDLMGLLLVISPPGYGKTTLMEYIANRLGVIFVKINGPAIGQGVTSLDPEDAPNAAAREEVQKLNLALEMGDNVMIYLDDIQHCHSEFLQKFISLCDAQRKIEGVWRGKPSTYDLRGRKVVVVMAGNPYTESGLKFRIPDMLANRADTYNLGDIIGGNASHFKASYLENAVTSNTVLAPLATQSQKDIRLFIRMAESGDRNVGSFEGSYSAQQLEEILTVMKKLLMIRDAILRVNQQYIDSAAQADEFRTEPPFKLQGSYRNMNRLAEKVVTVMNDGEIRELLLDHYKNEAQTLATGAEANLLKFKELMHMLTAQELARWEEIKKTFRRNQLTRSGDQADPVGRIVGQLSGFQAGLESIQSTLEKQLSGQWQTPAIDFSPVGERLEALRTLLEERLSASSPKAVAEDSQSDRISVQLGEGLKALGQDLGRALASASAGAMTSQVASLSHELEMIHSTLATLKDLAAQQRNHLRDAQELLATRAKQGTVEIDLTQEMLTNERAFLERFHQVLAESQGDPGVPPGKPSAENT